MLFGKVRNLKAKKLEKEKITNNAVRAAAIEIRKKKTTQNKYTKKYTQKEWDRFGDAQKQILTARYHVVLTDYETKSEKRKKFVKNLPKNFDKTLDKFDKGQKQFWSEWDKGFDKAGAKKGTIFNKPSKKQFTKKSKNNAFGSSNNHSIMGSNKNVKW